MNLRSINIAPSFVPIQPEGFSVLEVESALTLGA